VRVTDMLIVTEWGSVHAGMTVWLAVTDLRYSLWDAFSNLMRV